jgi:hypothetical protein
VSGIEITETFLFAVSVYIAIASVMVFLSLVLRSRVNRWTNIGMTCQRALRGRSILESVPVHVVRALPFVEWQRRSSHDCHADADCLSPKDHPQLGLSASPARAG